MARILLAIDIHKPSRGGASEFVSSLASFLSARAHQVGVACHRARIFVIPNLGTGLVDIGPNVETNGCW